MKPDLRVAREISGPRRHKAVCQMAGARDNRLRHIAYRLCPFLFCMKRLVGGQRGIRRGDGLLRHPESHRMAPLHILTRSGSATGD